MHGKILTQDNLKRRGFQLPNRCILCKVEEESIDHLFIHCPFARHLWTITLEKCGMQLVF